MRATLHDARSDLMGVAQRTPSHAGASAMARAITHLTNAIGELTNALAEFDLDEARTTNLRGATGGATA
ncbi:MAG: hypothetical protein V4475_01795 [Pseudomonadota bacterium]